MVAKATKMAGASVLDANDLTERLRRESQDYWLHVQAASALEKYPAKQHARRVVEKLGISEGLIYLPGQPQRFPEDGDMPLPFRQRRYFYYLSGVNEVDCHMTYDIKNDILTLFIPEVIPRSVIYNGRGSTPAEALDKYDIDAVLYSKALNDFVSHWFHVNYGHGKLYLLHAWQAPALSTSVLVDSESLLPVLNHVRAIKDDHEIKLIKRANKISSEAHKKVLANIRKFKNESQVEGLFLNVCISNLAKLQAYSPIAGSGPNAGTLHYADNNEDFGDRQLLVLDAGCEWQLYASDITRTIPLTGDWASEEAKQIYRLVERMQETCIKRVGPGVRYLDLHILAHQIAIDGLLSIGIFHNGTKEEIYKAGTSKAFFMHGLGHHMGLDVHDPGQAELMSLCGRSGSQVPSLYPENYHVPVYDSKLCRSPCNPQSPHLEEGMVVTIEPGIYFSKYALDLLYLSDPVHSKYINVEVLNRFYSVGGCRIEDDILVTSKGYENLTSAPKGEAMLDIIRGHSSSFPSERDIAGKDSKDRSALSEDDVQRCRAPGISKHTQAPVLNSVQRAFTLPAVMYGTAPKEYDVSTQHLHRKLAQNTYNSVAVEASDIKRLQSHRPDHGPNGEAYQYLRVDDTPRNVKESHPAEENRDVPLCNLYHDRQRLVQLQRHDRSQEPWKKSVIQQDAYGLWNKTGTTPEMVQRPGSEEGGALIKDLVDAIASLKEKVTALSLDEEQKWRCRGNELTYLRGQNDGQLKAIESILARQTTLSGVASSSNDVTSYLESTLGKTGPSAVNEATASTISSRSKTTPNSKPHPLHRSVIPVGHAPYVGGALGQHRASFCPPPDDPSRRLNSGQTVRRASSLPQRNSPQPQNQPVAAAHTASLATIPSYRDLGTVKLPKIPSDQARSENAPLPESSTLCRPKGYSPLTAALKLNPDLHHFAPVRHPNHPYLSSDRTWSNQTHDSYSAPWKRSPYDYAKNNIEPNLYTTQQYRGPTVQSKASAPLVAEGCVPELHD